MQAWRTLPVVALAATLFGWVACAPARGAEVSVVLQQIAAAGTIQSIEELAETLEHEVRVEHLEPLVRAILGLDAAYFAREPLALEKGRALLRGLAAVPSHRVIAALETILRDAHPPLAREATLVLLAREDTGWTATLLQLLHSPATALDRRLALIEAFTDPEARELLPELTLLFDGTDHDEVRAHVLDVLQAARAPGLLALCKRALDEGGDRTRMSALRALVRGSDPQAMDTLLALRVTGRASCADLTSVLGALRGMRRTSEGQRQLLLTMLEDDICNEALIVTLGALAEAREERAAELARELADDPDRGARVNAAAVDTLLSIHFDDELEALLAHYAMAPPAQVRLVVAEKLLDLDRVEAVETLALFMESKDETLSKPALAALMRNKFREAIPYLIRALRHPDDVRREQFGEALQEHMRCFFPYRTPSVKAFLLDTPEGREQAIRTLLAWFREST